MGTTSLRFAISLFLAFCVPLSASAAEGSFHRPDGVEIYFTDSEKTEAPVVLLLHGYKLRQNFWLRTGLADDLAASYRVVTIDLRGHGQSGKPESPEDYGPKVGLDAIALLDHLEIPKAHMIGYSMGAFVVGRLLVTHAHRIESAMLASGSFPIQTDAEQEYQDHTAEEMESQGEMALASVARGWALDAVSEEQVSNISVPLRAVYGSEEVDEFEFIQYELLPLPQSALPSLIIEGTGHFGRNSAILHPDFLKAAKELIDSAEEKLEI